MEFILSWEAADNIGSQSYVWHVFDQEVTDFAEFFDSVLSIHFVQNWVGAGLDGYM